MKTFRLALSLTVLSLSAIGFAGCEYYPKGEITETSTEKTLTQGKSDDTKALETKLDELIKTLNNPPPSADEAEIKALKDQIAELQKKIEELASQTEGGSSVPDPVPAAEKPESDPKPQPSDPGSSTRKPSLTVKDPGRTIRPVVPAAGSPVSRFYNPATGDHFFTITPEKETVQDYVLESASAFQAYPAGTKGTGLIPVYRWLSADNRSHFYTTSKDEPKSGFNGEGIAFLAYGPGSIPAVNASPVFRLYNPGNGDHLYTADAIEKENAVANGYLFEGIAWYAPSATAIPNEAVTVHRSYNAGNGDHFYTTSLPEAQKAAAGGYAPETSGFKAHLAPKTEASVAVHRFYNAGNGDHFYTANRSEGDGAAGYAYEGIAFYAEPAKTDGTVALFRLYNPGNGDHFYTASASEKQTAIAGGYMDEGIACYVAAE